MFCSGRKKAAKDHLALGPVDLLTGSQIKEMFRHTVPGWVHDATDVG